MIWHRYIINLTTVLIIATVYFVPSNTEVCIYCDNILLGRFERCFKWKILTDPYFAKIPITALDDLNNSITAASSAIRRSSDSMKMKMMNGAMAGEIAEIILNQSSIENPEIATSNIMKIVKSCFRDVTGQEDINFTRELGKMVDFMLNQQKEPKRRSSENSRTVLYDYNAPSPYPAKAFASSSVFSDQNMNNKPVPYPQTYSTGTNANNFISYQKNNPSVYKSPASIIRNNQNTGPLLTAQSSGQTYANVANLPLLNNQVNTPYTRPNLISQPQTVNANVASSSYSFNSNPVVPPQIANTNPARSSYLFNSNPIVPTQIANANAASNSHSLNSNSVVQPQIINTNSASQSYLLPTNPIVQPQTRDINAVSSDYSFNPSPVSQPQFVNANAPSRFSSSNPNFIVKPQIMNAKSVGSDYSFNQYPIAQPQNTNVNIASSSYTTGQSKPNISPNVAVAQNNNAAKSNVFSINNQNQPVNNKPYESLPRKNVPVSNIAPNYITKDKSNQRNQVSNLPIKQPNLVSKNSSRDYPQYQTVQYPNSNDNAYISKKSFVQNNAAAFSYDTPQSNNYNYPNLDYYPNKDNSNYAASNAQSGSSSGSSVDTYNQPDITTTSGYSSDSPPPITTKAPKKKKKCKSRKSKCKKKVVSSKSKSYSTTNKKSSVPKNKDDDIARAVKFAEMMYFILTESNIYRNTFNEKIPNDQAVSYVYTVNKNALSDCGYSKFSVEISNALVLEIESLPDGCPSEKYGEAIAKTLMDQFNIKKLLVNDPDDQAKCIANAFLTRLNSNKYPGPSKTTSNSDASYHSTAISNSSATATNENSNYPNYDYSTQYPSTDYPNYPSKMRPDSPLYTSSNSSATTNNKNTITNLGALQNEPNNIANNAANITAIEFYDALYYALLSYPYISKIYNTFLSNSDANSYIKSILVGSLSSDYGDKLAIEIASECFRRLSTVPTGFSTDNFVTVIATCITDIFSFYGLISLNTPAAQALDVSSKLINLFKDNVNNYNDNDQSGDKYPISNNYQDDRQNAAPNLENMNYPDYSDIQMNKSPGPISSAVASSSSSANTGSNYANYDYSTQYSSIDYPNYGSKQKTDSPFYTNNGKEYPSYYTDNVNSQSYNGQNKQLDGDQSYPIQNANLDTNYVPAGVNDYRNGDFDNGQQSISTSVANINSSADTTNQMKNRKCKQKVKNRKCKQRQAKNEVSKSTANAISTANSGSINANNNPINQDYTTTFEPFDSTTIQPQFPNNISSDYSDKSIQNTHSSTSQFQTILNGNKDDVKERVTILMKYALQSISNGKFDYKIFSNVMAALVKNVEETNPTLGSQKSLLKVLFETIIACTQLLVQVPSSYFDNINALQNPDATEAFITN